MRMESNLRVAVARVPDDRFQPEPCRSTHAPDRRAEPAQPYLRNPYSIATEGQFMGRKDETKAGRPYSLILAFRLALPINASIFIRSVMLEASNVVPCRARK